MREVIIDVNVGLPRCGCAPEDAGRLADQARARGLAVRGVMGYEGHVVGLADATERERQCRESMALLLAAHSDVGGELVSAGGTGTYALNIWASEIQAGSYALMDVAYGRLGLPFEQAVFVLATVVSGNRDWSVADAGLKTMGMDHGNPVIDGATVWFCSDEHTTFSPPAPVGRPSHARARARRPDDGLPRAAVRLLGRGRARGLAGRPARLVTGAWLASQPQAARGRPETGSFQRPGQRGVIDAAAVGTLNGELAECASPDSRRQRGRRWLQQAWITGPRQQGLAAALDIEHQLAVGEHDQCPSLAAGPVADGILVRPVRPVRPVWPGQRGAVGVCRIGGGQHDDPPVRLCRPSRPRCPTDQSVALARAVSAMRPHAVDRAR